MKLALRTTLQHLLNHLLVQARAEAKICGLNGRTQPQLGVKRGLPLGLALPSHLPYRPPRAVTFGSRRREKRSLVRDLAWRLAEWQLTIFNWFHLLCPRSADR